jgi:hypothetical protein
VLTAALHTVAVKDELEFLLAEDFTETQDTSPIVQVIRGFMLVEAATFAIAALVHSGLLLDGYTHREAAIAEGVVLLALALGLGLSWLYPAWTRALGAVAQSFALVGALVGIFFIAIDIAYYAGMALVVVVGMIFLNPQVYERAP